MWQLPQENAQTKLKAIFRLLFAWPIANLSNIAEHLNQVDAVYGGTKAEVIEQAMSNPTEQQTNGVFWVTDISSTYDLTGSSFTNVFFDQTTDIDIDQLNVQNRVSPGHAAADGTGICLRSLAETKQRCDPAV